MPRPVGPFGGSSNQLADAKLVKLRTYLDWGFAAPDNLGTGLRNHDIYIQVNRLLIDPTSDTDANRVFDMVTNVIRAASQSTGNNTIYAAGSPNTCNIPVNWADAIRPYERYQVMGVKVTMTFNEVLTSSMDEVSQAALSQEPCRQAVGIWMDESHSNVPWYGLTYNSMPITHKIWSTMRQHSWKELPSPLKPQPTVLKRYFSMGKYFGMDPDTYSSAGYNPANVYSGGITYYQVGSTNTGSILAVTQPSVAAWLHIGISQFGRWVDGKETAVSFAGPLTGRLHLTYYVKLNGPGGIAAMVDAVGH